MFSEEQQFIALKAKILKDRGLDCGQYKTNYLKRRIAVRMRVHGVESYREYMKILDSDALEYNKLMDCLTINVTQFFRDPATFEVLEKAVLPQLVADKQHRKGRVIRAWSAGCASGEEPFSLAILLSEVLGNKLRDFTVSIHATDIDEESLKKAERGKYEGLSMEKVKREYIDRYFTYTGRYKVKDEIRRSVRFKRHDLISEKALPIMEIGNRNVAAAKSKLETEGISLVGKDTGGGYGRSLKFVTSSGKVAVKSIRYGEKEL